MNYNSESKENIIVKNFPIKIKPMKWNTDMNLLRKSPGNISANKSGAYS